MKGFVQLMALAAMAASGTALAEVKASSWFFLKDNNVQQAKVDRHMESDPCICEKGMEEFLDHIESINPRMTTMRDYDISCTYNLGTKEASVEVKSPEGTMVFDFNKQTDGNIKMCSAQFSYDNQSANFEFSSTEGTANKEAAFNCFSDLMRAPECKEVKTQDSE